jgi:hypothetical protein
MGDPNVITSQNWGKKPMFRTYAKDNYIQFNHQTVIVSSKCDLWIDLRTNPPTLLKKMLNLALVKKKSIDWVKTLRICY